MNYYYIKRIFDQERFFINMDVYESVFRAIDIWLKDITIRENQIKIIKRKLRRNILQIKYEGLLSIIEISELEKISDLWIKLLYSIGGDKTKTLNLVLLLFHYEQISLNIVNRIIVKLFSLEQ